MEGQVSAVELMRNDFPGYYRPTTEQFADILTDCIFVMDANVLLNLYRYEKVARDDLLRVLKEVARAFGYLTKSLLNSKRTA